MRERSPPQLHIQLQVSQIQLQTLLVANLQYSRPSVSADTCNKEKEVHIVDWKDETSNTNTSQISIILSDTICIMNIMQWPLSSLLPPSAVNWDFGRRNCTCSQTPFPLIAQGSLWVWQGTHSRVFPLSCVFAKTGLPVVGTLVIQFYQ